MYFSKEFSISDPNDQESGTVSLVYLWADVYAIKIKKTKAIQNAKPWANCIRQAIEKAKQKSAREIIFRLIKNEGLEKLGQALTEIGFFKKNERFEFRKSVVDLPQAEESVIQWKTCQQLDWDPQKIAQVITLVSFADPDYNPKEDPILFIQDFLTDPVLTAGRDCVHIGFINEEIAALTVVQINPTTGWSRISYMGIAPNFRRQKLGQVVHRYSFKIMKAMGGKIYHGGTASTNRPMIRLFELHGCEKFREMEEWRYYY